MLVLDLVNDFIFVLLFNENITGCSVAIMMGAGTKVAEPVERCSRRGVVVCRKCSGSEILCKMSMGERVALGTKQEVLGSNPGAAEGVGQ